MSRGRKKKSKQLKRQQQKEQNKQIREQIREQNKSKGASKGGSRKNRKKLNRKERRKKKEQARKISKNKKTISNISKEQLVSQLTPVINLANTRWNKLDQLDLRSNAISTALESSQNDERFFYISSTMSKEEILAEATRARVFINDPTSTIKGAEVYTEELNSIQWKGQFGAKYKNYENKYKSYNTKLIDEEAAKAAFRAYRMLEEIEGARIEQYGSEETIIEIFDITIKGGFTEKHSEEIAGIMSDFLSQAIGEKRKQYEEVLQQENQVGYIVDYLNVDKDWW